MKFRREKRLASFDPSQSLALGGGMRLSPSVRGSRPLRKFVGAFLFLGALSVAGIALWGKPAFMNAWPFAEKKSLDVNATIVPPKYTELPPVVLAVEAGPLHTSSVVDVPLGSTLKVDLPDQDNPPSLEVGGKAVSLKPDGRGRLAATASLENGDSIILAQGWNDLASWKVRVLKDAPPRVAFVDAPINFKHKATRLSYEASDDYGIKSIVLLVRPVEGGQGPKDIGMKVVLSAPGTRHVKEATVEDLTFLPWAGSPVDLQLEVADAAGNSALSEIKRVTLPRREFSHPLARALVEEREKLLQQPDDSAARDEMANIMAGIARETATYGADPVVFMALRTGAVRLVLDKGDEVLPAVSRLIWQAAARIEDTMKDQAQEFLRQAHQDKG